MALFHPMSHQLTHHNFYSAECLLLNLQSDSVSFTALSLRGTITFYSLKQLVFILYCRRVDLQCSVWFQSVARWLSYTCVHSLSMVIKDSAQSLSRVRLFATPRTAARQASLSITCREPAWAIPPVTRSCGRALMARLIRPQVFPWNFLSIHPPKK